MEDKELLKELNKLRLEHLPMKIGCLLIALIWAFGFSAIGIIGLILYIYAIN